MYSKKNWFVTYEVEGFGSQKAGPYSSYREAQFQANDIMGYEKVYNTNIIQEKNKKNKNGKR